ncbi:MULTISPECIES: flagellar biosynthesis protein FliQ [unclassified Janthinobacterium]|jgi:flagellar biosynthetic protein FliQ|uniref:flagellar biosynthesis protein FliQ n=1 Tax=unclassified Janthinobacterium TaxID=2610881 RepID=UPI0008827F25|nr:MULTISPECIES: flagellar biosynthesis protein FliQ [unclassified Janthinobacterium]SDA44674.1 flagellar biosynthetic protein FliQ [Janthinobacterium sp. 551a]SFA94355.1 flagellar biosynthetic protein FliQ [Janthinobacterium sp. 344]
MTPESVMTLGRQAMEITLMVAAPMLLVALIIGLIVSIFQAATQINEATLSFIPKLVGIFVAIVVAGPWMLSVMLDYMRQVFTGIPNLVG